MKTSIAPPESLFAVVLVIPLSHITFRSTAILLLCALLAPTFMFGDFQKVSGGSVRDAVTQTPPVSASPEAFLVSNGNSFGNFLVSGISNFLSFSSEKIFVFFNAPKVPDGLEQPASQNDL